MAGNDWESEMAAALARFTGPGVSSIETLRAQSGLDFLHGILEGRVPRPPISDTSVRSSTTPASIAATKCSFLILSSGGSLYGSVLSWTKGLSGGSFADGAAVAFMVIPRAAVSNEADIFPDTGMGVICDKE